MQSNEKRIYKLIVDEIEGGAVTRAMIIEGATVKLCGGNAPMDARARLRGSVGAVFTKMLEYGVIASEDGKIVLKTTRSTAVRTENLEREILTLLSEGPVAKTELRDRLDDFFKTKSTPSEKDDLLLTTITGQVVKRLTSLGIIRLYYGKYEIAPEKAAEAGDITAMIALKADFITRLHAKGGEFFEHYIVTLLAKYLRRSRKRVTAAYVNGGVTDGGIDGIIRTEDVLGFREEIMIQAKNRTETVVETAVRGFYGSVCAAQGSRGIFATTSDFHPTAKAFLDGIDNCVGVSGEDIFEMAKKCRYGIRKKRGVYMIDAKIL